MKTTLSLRSCIRQLAFVVLLSNAMAQAQMIVAVSPLKINGQKAAVLLAITNNLAESVESARAICFLLDDQGKMIGQSTKWVVGGTKELPALTPKSGTAFNFVITSPQTWTTSNLTAKLSFTRVVLASGKLADVAKDVQIESK